MLNQQWQKKQFMEAKETFADGGGRNYANNYFSNQSRQDAISRVSAVQKSARGPRWELWRSGVWNIRSHQRCRLQRDGYDFYGYPPLHLEAHAYCTKAKKHSNFRHNLFDTGSPMSKSCVLWNLRAFICTFFMRVCIYVYVCICADIIYVYICMWVCIYTSMRLYTCVCVCVCIFVHRLWVLVSVLQRVDGVMHAHMFSCSYACVYICV